MNLKIYCFGWFALAVLCPATSNPVVVTRRISNVPSSHLSDIQGSTSSSSQPINLQEEVQHANYKNNYTSVDVTSNVDGKKPENFKVVPHPTAHIVRDASSDGVEDLNNNIHPEKENDEKNSGDGKQPDDDAKLNYRLLSSTEESPSIALYNNNDELFNFKENKYIEEPLHTEPVHKKFIAQQKYKVKNNQKEESSSKVPVTNRPYKYKAIFKDESCYKTHHNHRETNNIPPFNVESTGNKKEYENKSFNEVKTYYYTGSKGFRTVDEDPIGDEGENYASEGGDVDKDWGFP